MNGQPESGCAFLVALGALLSGFLCWDSFRVLNHAPKRDLGVAHRYAWKQVADRLDRLEAEAGLHPWSEVEDLERAAAELREAEEARDAARAHLESLTPQEAE